MVKISQIKIPVELICESANKSEVRHGILGTGETELLRKAVADLLHMREDKLPELMVLKRSMDARKKHQLQFVYQVACELSGEKKWLSGALAKKGILSAYRSGKAKWPERTEREEKADEMKAIEATANRPDESIFKEHFGRPNDRLTKISVNQTDEQSSKEQSGQKDKHLSKASASLRPVIVGTGPAGLFAALTLARQGIAPIVLERGADVDQRQEQVEAFWKTGRLNPETNVQFGEGGAGTFSDGKLNTLIKDPLGYGRLVLETFVEFGAPAEILYQQKPHIGTDRLRQVVKQMRLEIERLGGEIHFGTRLDGIVADRNHRLQEIRISKNPGQGQQILSCHALLLATGHSARDTVASLYEAGVTMQPKSFAMGVRVQHRQEMIGRNQYGVLFDRLPPADYKLTHTTKEGRGVYSFCMCPGGYVVNASSEEGHLVVNGMSYYERDGENANSAIVVTISPEDYGNGDVLSGIAFQRKWERAAYQAGQGRIPVQLLGDYAIHKKSTGLGLIRPMIKGEYSLADVRAALPDFVGDAILEGMQAYDRRIPGFGAEDVLIAGVESRTSSPVRILRDEHYQSNIRGLYPCGEGAGYAGGITSAAIDGIRVAEEIATVGELWINALK